MAIAYVCLCTQLRKRAIDFVARNRASLNVKQGMRIAPEKTDHAVLRVHSDAVAISILLRRRNDWSHRNVLEFADPLKSVTNLPPFDRKLTFVAHVLVSASAASAEIQALRFDTIRGGLLDPDEC